MEAKSTILKSLTLAALCLIPVTAQNQQAPARPAQRQVTAPQNCYFPPCTGQAEFPMKGTAVGLQKGDTVVLMDANGKTLSSAPVQPNGEYELPAPAPPARGTAAPGPIKTCILRPGKPLACGAAGVREPAIPGVQFRPGHFSPALSGIKTIPNNPPPPPPK